MPRKSAIGRIRFGMRQRRLSAHRPTENVNSAERSAYHFDEDCQIPNLNLYYQKYLGVRSTGLFVEVGAYDGLAVSNSLGLARMGWRGLYFEADPIVADKCRTNLRHFPDVRVITAFISASTGQQVALHRSGPLSTASAPLHATYSQTEWTKKFLTDDVLPVESVTLDAELSRIIGEEQIDVLIVDVEGFEAEVLTSFSFDKWRPRVVVVELTDHHPNLWQISSNHAKVRRLLHKERYCAVYSDAINTLFVAESLLESNQICSDE